MPRVHQRNVMISRNSWNALMRIGGSIYNIYYLLGGIYCVYTTLYLHLSLLHSRAVNGSAICHLYTFWSEVWKWYVWIYVRIHHVCTHYISCCNAITNNLFVYYLQGNMISNKSKFNHINGRFNFISSIVMTYL